jgi:hypothetical protein
LEALAVSAATATACDKASPGAAHVVLLLLQLTFAAVLVLLVMLSQPALVF